MFGVYSVAQVRQSEVEAMDGRDDLELMLRASTGLAIAVARALRRATGGLSGRKILVLVGPGNNGGDALFAGQWLARRGVQVTWCAVLGTAHPRGRRALQAAGGRETTLDDAAACLERVDLVVDGVLGIGGRGGLPSGVAELGEQIAAAAIPVVAVDVPSGLAADSGAASEGTFLPASLTVTFGARKLCQVLQPAASVCGRVSFVDIGLRLPAPELRCWERADVAEHWPMPGPASHKYTRGVVGVDAGSDTYPGAGLLCASGAVSAGAGMVRFLGSAGAKSLVVSQLPNVVTAAGQVQSVVLGPGWGQRPDGVSTIMNWRSKGTPLVLDADALRSLPAGPLGEATVLTPHAGELARLLHGERARVEADPVGAVRAAVQTTGATVLLKGAVQLVAGPDSPVIDVAVPGPAWTAQAGSGDVLAGIIGTLLAAGVAPRAAAIMGASVQALAADARPGPYPPQAIAQHIPAVIASFAA